MILHLKVMLSQKLTCYEKRGVYKWCELFLNGSYTKSYYSTTYDILPVKICENEPCWYIYSNTWSREITSSDDFRQTFLIGDDLRWRTTV